MKLNTTHFNDFRKKTTRAFYTLTKNETYRSFKELYTYFRTNYRLHNNLLSPSTVFFDLIVYRLNNINLPLISKFRPGTNDKGFTILVALKEDIKRQNQITHADLNLTTLDVNFLRKEKIYAKLKYSRSPQYDIASGGIAAIFSGFLGFLICEKFGLELLDSGDFYTAFMYAVFIVFACRPLVRTVNGFNKDKTYTPSYQPLSLQPCIQFYTTLTKLLFNLFKFRS